MADGSFRIHVSLMIFDEAHNARGKVPYCTIMQEHYKSNTRIQSRPRIFGATASATTAVDPTKAAKDLRKLEDVLDSKLIEVKVHRDAVLRAAPRPNKHLIEFDLFPTPATAQTAAAWETALRALEPDVKLDNKTWNRLNVLKQELGTLGCDVLISHLAASLSKSPELKYAKTSSKRTSFIAAFLSDLTTYLSSQVPTATNSSPRFRALVDVLAKYRLKPDFHAMVFVQLKTHANVVVDLLGPTEELKGWVRADFLVGNAGKVEDGKGVGRDGSEGATGEGREVSNGSDERFCCDERRGGTRFPGMPCRRAVQRGPDHDELRPISRPRSRERL